MQEEFLLTIGILAAVISLSDSLCPDWLFIRALRIWNHTRKIPGGNN
jgi:hypothetical protein